jgi:hypothetical protein
LAPEGSTYGYVAAFLIEAGFLAASLFMLRQINVGVFKRHATESEYVPAVIERAAVGGES